MTLSEVEVFSGHQKHVVSDPTKRFKVRTRGIFKEQLEMGMRSFKVRVRRPQEITFPNAPKGKAVPQPALD